MKLRNSTDVNECSLASIFAGLFVEASVCEIVHALEFNMRRDLWGMFLLLATWAREYMICKHLRASHVGAFKNSWMCVMLTELCQHVNEMMAVTVNSFHNFRWSSFLIIIQNVSKAATAILHCGLTSDGVTTHIALC